MGVTINGVALTKMIHNGVEVQRWVHNGVEVFTSSKAWAAYEVVNSALVGNSPALAPPSYSAVSITTSPARLMWEVQCTGTYHYISTKNENGGEYLPTQKCKCLDVVVRTDINYTNKCTITGRKDGIEEVISTITIPKYNDNKNNIVDGVAHIKYVYLVENVDVSKYTEVKVVCNPTTFDTSWIGLGLTRFHN